MLNSEISVTAYKSLNRKYWRLEYAKIIKLGNNLTDQKYNEIFPAQFNFIVTNDMILYTIVKGDNGERKQKQKRVKKMAIRTSVR